MRSILLLVVTGIALAPANGLVVLQAQRGVAAPRDEAPRDSSLVAFRERLLSALEQHDTATVVAQFHPDVRLDFGGGAGRALLLERLRQETGLWGHLREALTNGGRFFDDSTFAAPYWYTVQVDDPFDVWIVIGTRVRVRQAPRLDAPILTTLSHVVVGMDHRPRETADGWGAVVLADGRRGYMSARYLRSPVGYRVIISRQGGAWVITAFVAGD